MKTRGPVSALTPPGTASMSPGLDEREVDETDVWNQGPRPRQDVRTTCCRSLRLSPAWGPSNRWNEAGLPRGLSENPEVPSPTCPPTSGV